MSKDHKERVKHPHGRGEDFPKMRDGIFSRETPPRAWGRLREKDIMSKGFRNTPTGVGKTKITTRPTDILWKHPHGRGEDFTILIKP